MKLFATCARGLEGVLAKEIELIGAHTIVPGRGGVSFEGDQATLYKANLWLRTAIRVLVTLLEGETTDTDDLYEWVRTIDWSELMTPGHTLAVDCNVRDSYITHSQYAARRVKDAICDQFVDRVGIRPSVDKERPMVGLNLHIHRNKAVLSLDSSGDSLHKRGYRPALTKAPLNESLASGILYLSGWQPSIPLYDPMCGSGVFPIEACWMALNRPPGLTRKHFGLMGWMDFDIQLWTGLRDQARTEMLAELPAPIVGSDIRKDVVEFAKVNGKTAGVGNLLKWLVTDVCKSEPPTTEPGIIICNPPYGERIGDLNEIRELYQWMGDHFRKRFQGWRFVVFTSEDAPWKYLGPKPEKSTPLWNGKIQCKLLNFSL
ncbi:MAG: THUMP domain-containing protein [Zavarzinella sp.]